MARRRRVGHEVSDRSYDRRVEAWATDADYAAVAAAGTDEFALAAVTRGHFEDVRYASIAVDERQAWALSCLAAGRRNRAITAWALANGLQPHKAIAHYAGEPQLIDGKIAGPAAEEPSRASFADFKDLSLRSDS